MSKDFAQIANDVIDRRRAVAGRARHDESLWGSFDGGDRLQSIDTKTKELMALAIGIAVHCDGCVAYHTKMAHQHGATREEVPETVALPCTWVVDPRRCTEEMRCAPTISSRCRRVALSSSMRIDETGMPATGKSPIKPPFPRHATTPPAVSPARVASARPRSPAAARSRLPNEAGACCWSARIPPLIWMRCSRPNRRRSRSRSVACTGSSR